MEKIEAEGEKEVVPEIKKTQISKNEKEKEGEDFILINAEEKQDKEELKVEDIEVKFKIKYLPLWLIFSILVAVILVSYTIGKSNADDGMGQKFFDVDRLLGFAFDSIDPHVQKWKKEAFNRTYEPLRRYLESTVDPIFDNLKLKLLKFKTIINHYIHEPDDDEETLKFLEEIRSLNLTAKHPIIVIPGSITSKLEVWESKSCMNFRDRVWGGLEMFKTFLRDIDCWIEHIMLDEDTGMDPPGIRVRPRAEAIEFFVPYFWIWGRLVEEMSRLGYDRNNMKIMEYDWRLSYGNLQKRDNYFQRVKMNIETLHAFTGEKVVILTHSMGGLVANHFLNWVESSKGGNEQSKWMGLKKNKWCDKNIESVVNLGSPILGLPKVLSSLLSGEMKDTASLYRFDDLIEKLLPKEGRIRAFRSWGSMLELIPKGPAELWGSLFNIPSEEMRTITMDSLIPFLKNNTDEKTSKKLDNHFFGVKNKFKKNEIDSPKYWSNPFSFQLPYAPSMKIYCLYGVGIDTEIGYDVIERKNRKKIEHELLDEELDDEEKIWKYEFDFVSGDNANKGPLISDPTGDGTCPRVSMGYCCNQLWKDERFNPGNVKTYTREYSHKPIENILSKQFDLRGGGFGSSHVDILGNLEVLRDLMFIVSGNSENITDSLIYPDFEKIEIV